MYRQAFPFISLTYLPIETTPTSATSFSLNAHCDQQTSPSVNVDLHVVRHWLHHPDTTLQIKQQSIWLKLRMLDDGYTLLTLRWLEYPVRFLGVVHMVQLPILLDE